ncbi:hypothetical protein N7454_007821 [Penicillium verhagenii]|nr:hypothetical protein N7454_007821 [Penicillium verhagenii]
MSLNHLAQPIGAGRLRRRKAIVQSMVHISSTVGQDRNLSGLRHFPIDHPAAKLEYANREILGDLRTIASGLQSTSIA